MNDQTVFETSEAPEVTVEVSSDLVVRGWDRQEVRARSSAEEELQVQQDGDQVHIHSVSDCDLRIPHGASLHVAAVHGEATIRDIHGPVTAGQASAKLSLRDVADTRVDFIGGSITARDIQGDLSLGKVGGSANLRNISADLHAESIGGSLRLKGIVGNLTAEVSGNTTLTLDQINGDINLKCYGATKISLEPKADQTHTIESYGPLTCRFPNEIDAQINLTSHGPVKVNLGDISKREMEGAFTFHFGDSKSTLNLTSYGPVKLVGASGSSGGETFEVDFDADFDFDFEEQFVGISKDIGEQASTQLEAQMEALESQLEAQMANLANLMETVGLSEEMADRIHQRTQEKLARAQEKVRRAQERAARKIAAAQSRAARKAERSARKKRDVHKHIPFLSGHREAASEREPVAEEERMMILNMLAENKISIEEAEALLTALEGQDP